MSQKQAKRLRQERRHNMAESELKMDESPNHVTTCTGTKNHDPRCDGTCPIIEMTEMNIKVNQEKLNWIEAGMQTSGVVIDTFQLECAQSALIRLLVDKGLLDMDEADAAFQSELLDRMVQIRERFQGEQSLREAQAKILVPNAGNGIVVPQRNSRKFDDA